MNQSLGNRSLVIKDEAEAVCFKGIFETAAFHIDMLWDDLQGTVHHKHIFFWRTIQPSLLGQQSAVFVGPKPLILEL